MRWLWLGIRLGLTVGLISGVLVGLVAGIGGSLCTYSLPDLAAFAVSAFWLMLVVLPLVYALSYAGYLPSIDQQDWRRDHRYTVTAVAWLSAFLTSIIAFMMPVVMIPLVTGRGVTIENSADWYKQVYTPLLGWRVVAVAIGTLTGFAVVAAVLRKTHVHKPLPTK